MFRYAKEYISQNSKYSPVIVKNIPQRKVFPVVIIKQIADDLYDENLDKTDQRFNIGFNIEIYAMNKDLISKEKITRELVKLVNDVFDEHYGLLRASNQEVPNIDTDVYRWAMRYEGKIDESNIIYRR